MSGLILTRKRLT